MVKYLKIVVILFILSSFSYADSGCGEKGSEFNVILNNEKTCVLLIKETDHYSIEVTIDQQRKLYKNLVDLSTFDEISYTDTNVQHGLVKISFIYPINSYSISFDKDGIVGVYKEYRLPFRDEFSYLELSAQDNILPLHSDRVYGNAFNIFDDKIFKLECKSTCTAQINVDRSYLRKKPNENKSKVYVVKNDVVELLKYENGWLYVSYKSSNGKIYQGWIKIDDII
ncbi:hypothetical protein QCD60_25180 [Pokkaliibacter sp. MBI-7]|uniref:hypothetical protein n=1 Tax=Pokkaliibacter sp. MBI-7 TaxID=3040600 RepID=UPI002448C3DC|nr:hypothetical protein [Pokkaliibacter sp. MBI-7]MDH2435827.1 hypothetical protein [Pokkaliibacter sp. MBI-7]